jgi:exopolysaccharide/PEP-CTERM locus tyrosine autokinase
MDMSRNSALKARGSLLERAAEIYDFSSGLRVEAPAAPASPAEEPDPEPAIETHAVETEAAEPAILELTPAEAESEPKAEAPTAPVRSAPAGGRFGRVDRETLETAGYILPGAPVTGLAEEFRIIKRQLLLGVNGGHIAGEKRRTILVCSSQPDEGKTFSAVNLALSLATEKDLEVLLVDGDFNNPGVLSTLGLEDGPGLIDAIADPAVDAESFVIRTDIEGLSVLPAGAQANNITELLASSRTREVLADLTARRPRRIVLFDSPPALMASPATVMATHVGQVMMVVRADVTTEADLREAVALLSGCDHLSLMLNATGFAANGRRFGTYYGYGHD